MATVNLNKNASALCGDNTKVRIRMVDGEVQILPTNRAKGNNLPKGEQLIDLRVKKQAVRALRFNLPKEMELALGSMFRTEVRKHGWIALVSMTEEQRTAALTVGGGPKPAGCSISAK